MERIFIVPNNDLEAKTIIELLEKNGEDYIVTGQAWGASWENLEPEIKEKIEEAKKMGKEIYGVELKGDSNGNINIDHHIYGEDDRSNPKSSIEQVADILGVELSIDEQFIAANDKGYIPEMKVLGQELGIQEEDLKAIIDNIRMRDRQMQGVTIEQESQAQEAVECLGEIEEKQTYILIDSLPHSKTSTITDRLYGKYDNLLITSQDGETNFYGATEIIEMLNEKFPGGWSGGQLEQGNGFWGGYADQEAIKQAVQEMIDKIKEQEKENDKVKEFWLKKYSEDKIGTVAKLSQAMQHGAWLREWQRIHGEEPRIKPITKKVNGEKVKIGEADIAVPWSKLPEFFRQGNEYGDIETVKFLSEKISNGDISQLSQKELYTLSEKENVKWSDGKHSLNPFQGYLYEFIKESNYALYTSLGEEDYGHFYPLQEYVDFEKDIPYSDIRDMDYENDDYGNPKDYEINDYDEDDMYIPSELEQNLDRVGKAFSRYYTTRFLQKLIRERNITEYKDFLDFDITSVTTPEQIDELDEMLEKMVNSPEIEKHLEAIEGNAKFEEELYDSLRTEVMVEIKKDSDRIENAHKVFVALETGNMDELLADPETAKWAREVYEEERRSKEIIDE